MGGKQTSAVLLNPLLHLNSFSNIFITWVSNSMAGTTKAPSSLGDVVTLGEQLGTALQGIVETFLDEEEPIWILRDITSEIHSTASTLRRLQDKIRIHNSSNENCRVFKEEGLKEIWDLSLKCGKTYETILALADKAVCLKAGGEGKEVLTFNINVRNRLDVGLLVRNPLSLINHEICFDFAHSRNLYLGIL